MQSKLVIPSDVLTSRSFLIFPTRRFCYLETKPNEQELLGYEFIIHPYLFSSEHVHSKTQDFLAIKVQGEWKSPISKHLSGEEKQQLVQLMQVEEGDLLLISVGEHLQACN